MKNYSTINRCPITGDTNHIKYFDLGQIPLVNNLTDTRDQSLSCEKFPLCVNYFEKSGLSSLDFFVDSELLFLNYLFKSGVNIPYYNHCQDMFIEIQNFIEIKDGTKIADIGGNDGTLLDAFRSKTDKKIEILNIDPSKNLVEICLQKNIPVYNDFFNNIVAKKINKKFNIITSTNVFQHLKDINSFVDGILFILEDDGIWILEFPYWIHDMETNQFDQIYHEHMYYYSVKPIDIIMRNHGLKIINITKKNIHGGTLRLTITKENSNLKSDDTVDNYLKYEEKFDIEYYKNWGDGIKKHIKESYDFIKDLKSKNKKIYGFGASAKGCIYLNAMGLSDDDIDVIIDDTDIKQGKFIPGTGIKVVDRSILLTDKPDYILILVHNFKEYIMETLKEHDVEFIILVPEVKIYKNN